MANAIEQDATDQQHTIERIAVTDLRFDRESTRFSGFSKALPDTDLELIAHTYSSLYVHALARSIATWGFSPEPSEALDVMPDPDNDGAYVVLDGNRRLAAVRVLTATDDEMASTRNFGLTRSERDFMDDAGTAALVTLPARIHRDPDARARLAPWIEARHNNGSDRAPWHVEGMARVVISHLRAGMDHKTVARCSGLSRTALTKMVDLDALMTILPTVDTDLDDLNMPRPRQFFDVIDGPNIRTYLGLDPRPYADPGAVTVEIDPERLRDLCVALDIARRDSDFGYETIGAILLHNDARAELFANRDPRRARMLLSGSKERFMHSINEARVHMREAMREASGLVGDETVLYAVQDMRTMAIETERHVVTDEQRALHAELAIPPEPIED